MSLPEKRRAKVRFFLHKEIVFLLFFLSFRALLSC
jgi:hypothetical protein